MQLKKLSSVDVHDKVILLRAGFDVPLRAGKIIDDRRIKDGLPTIEYLLSHGARQVSIIFHIGRPNGKVIPALSAQPVAELLGKLVSDPSRVIVYENLRFNQGEQTDSAVYARELARGIDIFVQDAFNTLYEKHTSIVGVPKLVRSVAGLLVEKECEILSHLRHKPQHPYIVIMGGAKIKDKLPVINAMHKIADEVLVGGALAIEWHEHVHQSYHNVHVAPDGVADSNGAIFDIGPETIRLFSSYLEHAKMVFWNGCLGKIEEKHFQKGTRAIAEIIAKLSAKTIVGGGDTVGFLDTIGLADKMSYISSGGGASLKFLAGEELPGLAPLIT